MEKKIDTIQKIWYSIRTMKHDYTFEKFMRAVDCGCQTVIGCSAHDLSDYPYREDWDVCAEELAFIAPEDTERREQVFKNHVSYTVDDVASENAIDLCAYERGVDY